MSRSRKFIQTRIEDIVICYSGHYMTKKDLFLLQRFFPRESCVNLQLRALGYVSGLGPLYYKTEADSSLSTSYNFVLCHFSNLKFH